MVNTKKICIKQEKTFLLWLPIFACEQNLNEIMGSRATELGLHNYISIPHSVNMYICISSKYEKQYHWIHVPFKLKFTRICLKIYRSYKHLLLNMYVAGGKKASDILSGNFSSRKKRGWWFKSIWLHLNTFWWFHEDNLHFILNNKKKTNVRSFERQLMKWFQFID